MTIEELDLIKHWGPLYKILEQTEGCSVCGDHEDCSFYLYRSNTGTFDRIYYECHDCHSHVKYQFYDFEKLTPKDIFYLKVTGE